MEQSINSNQESSFSYEVVKFTIKTLEKAILDTNLSRLHQTVIDSHNKTLNSAQELRDLLLNLFKSTKDHIFLVRSEELKETLHDADRIELELLPNSDGTITYVSIKSYRQDLLFLLEKYERIFAETKQLLQLPANDDTFQLERLIRFEKIKDELVDVLAQASSWKNTLQFYIDNEAHIQKLLQLELELVTHDPKTFATNCRAVLKDKQSQAMAADLRNSEEHKSLFSSLEQKIEDEQYKFVLKREYQKISAYMPDSTVASYKQQLNAAKQLLTAMPLTATQRKNRKKREKNQQKKLNIQQQNKIAILPSDKTP